MSGEAVRLGWRAVARGLPLLLFALLAGSAITVANPGLFWDDWVWIHQEPSEHIRISRELGIWWAGNLSNAIYATKDPVLLLRVVSLVAWGIAAAAMAYTLWVNRWLRGIEAVLLTALLLSAHVPIVRFVTSVAMYNVYIASFWLGCAVLSAAPRNIIARVAAAAFFFFSFHLNSMLVMYGMVLLWLFAPHARAAFVKALENAPEKAASPWRSRAGLAGRFSLAHQAAGPAIGNMLKSDWLFAALPFVFYAVIKLPSLALSTVFASQQRIYSDYNNVQIERLVLELGTLPRVFVGNIARYFILAAASVPPRVMLLTIGAGALLACLLPSRGPMPGVRNSVLLMLAGFCVFSFGVYPYLIVRKPPVLFDFYEARNIMPALGGLLLTVLGAANLCTVAAEKVIGRWALLARNAALGGIIGYGAAGQFVFGTDLAKDWLRQAAIENYFQANKQMLDRYGTFLFIDQTTGYRIANRQIWNYEYTGNLVNVFGAKTKLGISLSEYEGWPRQVPLLSDPVFRHRYNLSEHDPKQPQALIEINNSPSYPFIGDVLRALRDYWRGKPVGELAARYFVFSASEQLIEADVNVPLLRAMVASLEMFKTETGVYPYTTQLPPSIGAQRLLATRLPGERRVPAYFNEMPWSSSRHGFTCANEAVLAPYEVTRPELGLTSPSVPLCKKSPRCFLVGCGFLFMSDGIDYKLVFINPVDRHYVQQAFGDLMDPVRNGYGFWTPGAAKW